jgi:hypothetical protein
VVAVTNLILTMPEHYAMIANRRLPNQIVPLPLQMPPLDAYLYWHADVDRDPANRWLRELLANVFRPATVSRQTTQVRMLKASPAGVITKRPSATARSHCAAASAPPKE